MAEVEFTVVLLLMLAIRWLSAVAAVVVGVWIAEAWRPTIIRRFAAAAPWPSSRAPYIPGRPAE